MEGMEVIFKVALALLNIAKDDILSLDMEGMLKVIFDTSFSPNLQEPHRP